MIPMNYTVFTKGKEQQDYNDKSLDFIIMDYIDEGLEYINECMILHLKEPLELHKKYLSTYLKLYLENKYDYVAFSQSISIIVDFHKNMMEIKFDLDINDIWFSNLYQHFLTCFKKREGFDINLSIFCELLNCQKFRLFFYEKHFRYNNKLLEKKTILGYLIANIDGIGIKAIESLLYQSILKCDYCGKNFLLEWTKFIYNINSIRIIDNNYSIRDINSEVFLMNTLNFIYHIWYKFYQFNSSFEKIQDKNIVYYLFKLIDITIVPIVSNIKNLCDRINELDELNLENNASLSEMRNRLNKNVDLGKKIITANSNLMDNISIFLQWLANLVYGITDQLQDDVIYKIIFDFYTNCYSYLDQPIPNVVYNLSKKILDKYDQDKDSDTNISLAYVCFNLQFIERQESDIDIEFIQGIFLKIYKNISKYNDYYRYKFLLNLVNYKTLFNVNKIYKDNLIDFLKLLISDINHVFDLVNEKNNLFLENTSLLINTSLDNQNILMSQLDILMDLLLEIIDTNDSDFQQIYNIVNNFIVYNLNTLSNFLKLEKQVHDKCCYNCLLPITEKMVCILYIFIKKPNFRDIFNNNKLEKYQVLEMPLINQDVIEKITYIKNSLDKIVEYPSEFCDPLLYTEIKTPVLIPETDIFMEKKIIENYIQDYNINPFSRNPLTQNQLNSYNQDQDVKNKVLEFLERKKKWYDSNCQS